SQQIELKTMNARGLAMIRQATCAVCGFLENCDFKVMDDAWKTIVPIEYRNQIVCVKCFEAFASAKQIELLRATACSKIANSRVGWPSDLHSKFTHDSPPVNLPATSCRNAAKISIADSRRWFVITRWKGSPCIRKSFIPTGLSRRFTSYVSAKTQAKKLIGKRQVAFRRFDPYYRLLGA